VYALGVVTYEMLTGEPPFSGPTAQAIVAKLLTTTPTRPSLARHTIPAHVEQAVLTALEKLPADRFATASQFAQALITPTAAVATTSTTQHRPPPSSTILRTAVGIAVLATVLAVWGWARGSGGGARASWRYVTLGGRATVTTTLGPGLALSPDGSVLVIRDDVQSGKLWVKRRGELDATPLAGTERALNPVFSPDGEWLAFVTDGRLKKMRIGGGTPITIADSAAAGYGGAAWLDDGTLLYVSPSLTELRRVSENGGAYTIVARADSLAGAGIGMPVALPGSRGALFQACGSGCVVMGMYALDLRSGTQRLLLPDVASAWLLPGNLLLYVRGDGVAMVAPFDLGRLEMTGTATPVLETVLVGFGYAQLAWSPSGAMVYMRGTGARDNTPVRVERNGAIVPIDSAWTGEFNSLSLSRDGTRLAIGTGRTAGGLGIWVKQLDRGAFTRLTFGGRDRRPVWSPDGSLIAFVRDTANTGYAAVIPADGSGPVRTLVRIPRQIQEVSWSRDGRWVLVRTDNTNAGGGDIVAARANTDTIGTTVITSSAMELNPAVSPNGRWLAHASDESGRDEVYVRPFPGPGGRWQVSTGGGFQPVWSPDGRELFFLTLDGRMMVATVRDGAAFAVADVRYLFDASGFVLDAFHQSFDITPDGRHFVFLSPTRTAGADQPQLVEVDNWFSDLRARVQR
jgi:serine/threonine-protein kinase